MKQKKADNTTIHLAFIGKIGVWHGTNNRSIESNVKMDIFYKLINTVRKLYKENTIAIKVKRTTSESYETTK